MSRTFNRVLLLGVAAAVASNVGAVQVFGKGIAMPRATAGGHVAITFQAPAVILKAPSIHNANQLPAARPFQAAPPSAAAATLNGIGPARAPATSAATTSTALPAITSPAAPNPQIVNPAISAGASQNAATSSAAPATTTPTTLVGPGLGWGWWPFTAPWSGYSGNLPAATNGNPGYQNNPVGPNAPADPITTQYYATPQTVVAGSALSNARAAAAEGAYQRAIAQASQAILDAPSDWRAHQVMEMALLASGDYPRAASEARAVVRTGGGVPGWDEISSLVKNRHIYYDQIRALQAYVCANPDVADGQFLLGFHALIGLHPTAARAHLARALAAAPGDPIAEQLLQAINPPSRQPDQTPADKRGS